MRQGRAAVPPDVAGVRTAGLRAEPGQERASGDAAPNHAASQGVLNVTRQILNFKFSSSCECLAQSISRSSTSDRTACQSRSKGSWRNVAEARKGEDFCELCNLKHTQPFLSGAHTKPLRAQKACLAWRQGNDRQSSARR